MRKATNIFLILPRLNLGHNYKTCFHIIILQLASTTQLLCGLLIHISTYCAVLGSTSDKSNVIPKNTTTPIVVVVPGLTSDSTAAVSCNTYS